MNRYGDWKSHQIFLSEFLTEFISESFQIKSRILQKIMEEFRSHLLLQTKKYAVIRNLAEFLKEFWLRKADGFPKCLLNEKGFLPDLNKKWYIFCYQNCSDLLWEKIVLVIEKNIRGWRPRICQSFGISRMIYLNSERAKQFLKKKVFFNIFLEVSQI